MCVFQGTSAKMVKEFKSAVTVKCLHTGEGGVHYRHESGRNLTQDENGKEETAFSAL